MMPAERPDHREFVSDLNNVVTLLQATDVYLLPSPPPEADAWLAERTMLVWKDAANAWQFKMQLLGERHQGAFDTHIDHNIIQGLENLEINPHAAEEISADLGSDLRAQITRPCLRLSLSQQNQIIAAINPAWPLTADSASETQIQICLTLLRGDSLDDFAPYLTLGTISRLAGNSSARIREFRVTNNNTTSGDVLRFIQRLLLASAKKLGHDEPVVLPALPQGSEVVYGSRPRPVENNRYEAAIRPILTVEMQVAIDHFETALTALEASVPNLSDEDREHLTQSLSALRMAKTFWFESSKHMGHLIAFRRATDELLQADHIQRLYTHQRLGVFGGRVESQELQNLRLSLRELRDFAWVRAKALDDMKDQKMELLFMLGLVCLIYSVIAAVSLNVMLLLAIPGSLVTVISAHYANKSVLTLFKAFLDGFYSGFSYDLWRANIEAFREFFTGELPQAFAAVVVISACYGLLVGELYAAAGMLAMASAVFLGFSLLMSTIMVVVFSLAAGYLAAEQWFNGTAPAENNMPEAIPELDDEEIGLAPA